MRVIDRANRWLPWALLAAAVVATAIVYWPGVTGGWVFDDYPNIVDNSAIHITPGHSTLVAWLNAALSSPASFLHRPLASITFAMNWMAGGGNPWPFKVTNIVIHLINGVLVFCMLRELLRLLELLSRSRAAWNIEKSAATRLALIVSAAWMLLPINLMAVLYVVQRMESLCQIFVLAGLWAYMHGRWMMLTAQDAQHDRRGFTLVVSGIVLGSTLGLTSKETAALLPLFAFLAEWIVLKFSSAASGDNGIHRACPARSAIPGQPSGSNPESVPLTATAQCPDDLDEAQTSDSGSPLRGVRNDDKIQPPALKSQDRRIWALFTATLFVPAILGAAWQLKKALAPGAYDGRDFTLVQRLLTEPRILVDYLHWTLFPNPMVLSLYHDEIVPSTGILTPWTTLGSLALLATLIGFAIWLRNRRPLVSLGIGWFFAAQLLTATFVPLELIYEQRMYFASIGVLLAAGALLLGLRWKIALPVLRGFVVMVALLWFAVATNLRAQEWSNPLRLAIAEANRHPESARAVYEAGRLLLIASNYQPGKALDESWKYLRKAASIPGSSALADQAMIMIADHHREGADDEYWDSMVRKLHSQPTRQEDISALVSLTNCYSSGNCKFDVVQLQRAYEAALSRPHPIARLNGAYASFQRDILHDDELAEVYLARAVMGNPNESAYRIDLAALYARSGQTERALEQIDALRRMNLAGRLDRQIATLERLAEQGKVQAQQ